MPENTPPDLPELPDDDRVESLADIVGGDLVPLSAGSIPVIRDGDTLRVVLRHAAESFGLDSRAELRRIRARSWARGVVTTSRDKRGRRTRMVTIDRRTYVMWLATIDENRVLPGPVRDQLVAAQNEAADALDAYVFKGLAINPRGRTPEQAAFLDNLFADRSLTWAKSLFKGWQAYSRAKGRYDGPDGKPLSAAERRASADAAGAELGKVYEQLIDAGLLEALRSTSIEGQQP